MFNNNRNKKHMKTYQEIAQPMESFVNRMLSHYGVAVMTDDEEIKEDVLESLQECSTLFDDIAFNLDHCLGKPKRIQLAMTVGLFTFVDECNLHKNGCNVVEKGTWNELEFNDVQEAFTAIWQRAAKTYGWEEFAA